MIDIEITPLLCKVNKIHKVQNKTIQTHMTLPISEPYEV